MSSWYERNKEECKAKAKAWKASNPDAQRAYYKKYSENNKDKVLDYQKSYAKANPRKCAAKTAKRSAIKLQQTPKWSDLKAIEEFYLNCPDGYEVDHIIPLQGRNVRGLHVLENLQYLTYSDNRRKGNR